MAQKFDLLGDPIPEGHGAPGRPEHIATKENRNRVRLLIGLGWKRPRIAGALRIDAKTLRKHYSRELRGADQARAAADAMVVEAVFSKAVDGSIAAARQWERIRDKADLADAREDFMRPAPAARPAREPRLGKKEEAAGAAKTAGVGTEWGDDLLGHLPN